MVEVQPSRNTRNIYLMGVSSTTADDDVFEYIASQYSLVPNLHFPSALRFDDFAFGDDACSLTNRGA